jgi:POT family proton-dependent oligopeptide transporter
MSDTSFFGHPRGLATLFFTEMWERFSYYGGRALLILFMTAPAATGGLEFEVPKAAAIYGMYTSAVYLLSLPGGWLADRFLGQRGAVLWGGVLIAAGNAGLATPSLAAFYAGLVLNAIGTGLLKPNVSTIVGQIYTPGDQRRDAGFSIFYMGINMGALLAPILCGQLGQRVGWRLGFGAASVFMVLGLIQYALGGRHLGAAGLYPVKPDTPAAESAQRRQLWIGGGVFAALLAATTALASAGVITAVQISQAFGLGLSLIVVVVFVWLLGFTEFTPVERKRLWAVFGLFLASCVFWSVFEQAGSTLNLFADRDTDCSIFGWSFPSSWFQTVQPALIVLLAPVFAWIWLRMGDRDPSSPTKFSLGLLGAGAGFLVMMWAASYAGVQRVSPNWLVTCYFLHTVGELCLSPVGLSAMTKLAPARIAGFTMGIWFLSTSVGNYLGSVAASFYEKLSLPTLFGYVGAFAIGAAVLMAIAVKPINKLMGGVR